MANKNITLAECSVLKEIQPPKVHGNSIAKITTIFFYTDASTNIIDLAEHLEEKEEIQAIGVIDQSEKALGIVTRKDLFSLLSKPFGREVLRKKTAESLVKEVQRFNANENIFTVSDGLEELVNSYTTHYFLLVNDKEEFCGIFSGKDMLVFLAEITRQDIALSRKIQTRIVKEEDSLNRPDFSLCASSVMAKGIGGDFYSFKKFSDSEYLIVLCDVSGKGMAASLLSSLLSGFMNTYTLGNSIETLVEDLNRQLTKSFAGDKFVTGMFLLFNELTGQLKIADMGHKHYVLYKNGKPTKPCGAKGNIPLGITEEVEVNTFNILMEKGDCFFMMTDGLIEQKNEEGIEY
ncbi:MAG: SpoIIE family protein phosphatase, partial [Spirochaetales bacterium]|nr:SpoIIE family protein phosphatase [Spirochaetales bacterium]